MLEFLSKYQCGFRKCCNKQHCLLAMLGKWKSAVDKGKSSGALLTDLSKAFDCLSHELLLAKLSTFGFSIATLKLIHSYLTNREQRTKANFYKSSEEILFVVPHGSTLGLLLFKTFLCYLFFIMSENDYASYVGDNTSYRAANIINEVIQSLENGLVTLFKWFSDTQMKANKRKWHLLVNKKDEIIIRIVTKDRRCEKVLGIKVDKKTKF